MSCLASCCLLTLLAGAPAIQGQLLTLDVGTDSAMAGATASLPVDLATNLTVTALQVDLTYPATLVTPTAAVGGDALGDHLVAASVLSPGAYRIVVYSPTNATLLSGRLFDVSLEVQEEASPQTSPIGITGVVVSSAVAAYAPPTALDGGSVTIEPASTDVMITKTGFVDVAEQIHFTVTATNVGAGPAFGVTVNDVLPAEVAGGDWSCAPSGGAACPFGPLSGNLAAIVDLPPAGQVVLEFLGTLIAEAGNETTNTASLQFPSWVEDSMAGNDSAVVTVSLTELVIFSDGFESGDTSSWSLASGASSLRVGFEVSALAQDGPLLAGLAGERELFRLESRQTADGRLGRVVVAIADGRLTSQWFALPDEVRMSLHWWSSRAPEAHNGGLRLWAGSRLLVDLTGLDDSGASLSRLVGAGPQGSVDPRAEAGFLHRFEVLEEVP